MGTAWNRIPFPASPASPCACGCPSGGHRHPPLPLWSPPWVRTGPVRRSATRPVAVRPGPRSTPARRPPPASVQDGSRAQRPRAHSWRNVPSYHSLNWASVTDSRQWRSRSRSISRPRAGGAVSSGDTGASHGSSSVHRPDSPTVAAPRRPPRALPVHRHRQPRTARPPASGSPTGVTIASTPQRPNALSAQAVGEKQWQ
jgi:hypothetical protein